jgi:glycoprotein-N-acetylgalactosamine 3-beta-galactosyltransferase
MKTKFKIFVVLIAFITVTCTLLYFSASMYDLTSLRRINDLSINFDLLYIKQPLEVKTKPTQVFCMILSSPKTLKDKARVVYNTWAHKCDDYRFISMLPEGNQTTIVSQKEGEYKDAIYDNMLKVMQPSRLTEESYEHLTDKVFYLFMDVYKSFNYFDWYLKVDDDTFIFVNNLKNFLKTKNSTNNVTYGYDFKTIVERGYHSGGGGYVLSKSAFNLIGSKLTEDYKFCPNSGTEDVDVAKCLRKLKVFPDQSLDEVGRERFHPLDIESHYKGTFPDWMYKYASNPLQKVI